MARRGGGKGGSRSQQQRITTSRGSPLQQKQQSSNSPRELGRKVTTPKRTKQEEEEDEELDEDAIEALFAQLERDLEAGDMSDELLKDLTEDEAIELENELQAVLKEFEEDEEESTIIDLVEEDSELLNSGDKKSYGSGMQGKGEEDNGISLEEDDKEEERVVTLEPWQLKKLAAAAQRGRRNTNVKSLAAEVGLDRFDVLAWLKNPPPEHLVYSATMESNEGYDEQLPHEVVTRGISHKTSSATEMRDVNDLKLNDEKSQRNWYGQKRLRKEHEATFERVFRNTDRPSNAMIQNMVELTHVPRNRIVDWFEHRRQRVKPRTKFESLR